MFTEFFARDISWRKSFFFITLFYLVSANALADDGVRQVSFNVAGLSLLAELQENNALLDKIASPLPQTEQVLYKGHFPGYPGSAIRVAFRDGQWLGLILLEGQLHKVNAIENPQAFSSSGLYTYQPDVESELPQICASPNPLHNEFPTASGVELPVTSHAIENSVAESLPATGGAGCANPINGVCLLPEIEFAYDLSYQALPSFGETPVERATREINEMEMFFETSFGFQFSRVSLTMLDAAQDAQIGSEGNPETLIDILRELRANNQLSYLQNSRSIFHFVTGRDFPTIPGPSGGNIIGIAYLDQVCENLGTNTGITDAGDTTFPSLVMAHEIGHNLGSGHDTPSNNSCPENQYVMSPSIGYFSSSVTAFSSCSIASINQKIASSLSAACFDFPVDVGITADTNNPTSPDKVAPFISFFTIDVESRYAPVSSVDINGSIADLSEGRFINAEVAGGVCTIAMDSYHCHVDNPPNEIALTVTTSAESDAVEFNVQHRVSTTMVSVVDVRSSNDSLNVQLSTFDGTAPGVIPETITSSNNSVSQPVPSSGGGGGGAMSPLFLLLISLRLIGIRLFGREYTHNKS